MKKQLRSSFSTQGRRMAGARALWAANGMKKNQMGKPIIAIVNSFTQFVPGHVHLHEIGQLVKAEIEKLGCFAAEFNTIAIDDGIAMGHDGMLYSLPSRDIIADSVEYMVNAHKADAMVCISNCDKITPGMLMAAMRLNIPAVFVSGGPMEAGEWNGQHLDLIDAMIKSADEPAEAMPKLKGHELIDNFIEKSETDPVVYLKPLREEEKAKAASSAETNETGRTDETTETNTIEEEDDSCFTETLAKIYVKQQRYSQPSF